MDTGASDRPELIDLCTPDTESTEVTEQYIVAVPGKELVSTVSFERLSNLDQRLKILPLYPTSDRQDQIKYPLLPNLPRMCFKHHRRSNVIEWHLLYYSSSPTVWYRTGSSIFWCISDDVRYRQWPSSNFIFSTGKVSVFLWRFTRTFESGCEHFGLQLHTSKSIYENVHLRTNPRFQSTTTWDSAHCWKRVSIDFGSLPTIRWSVN